MPGPKLLSLCLLCMALLLPAYAANKKVANYVQNGDFEEVTGGMPVSFYTEAYLADPSNVAFYSDADSPFSGKWCVTIENKNPNDAKLIQDLKLDPGTYKLTCQVRVRNILNPTGGANVTLALGSPMQTSTEISGPENVWIPLSFYIIIPEGNTNPLKVELRLGGFGAINQGKASFDALKVEPAAATTEGIQVLAFRPPSGDTAPKVFASDEKPAPGLESTRQVGPNFLFILCLAGILAAFILIWMVFVKEKNGENKPSPFVAFLRLVFKPKPASASPGSPLPNEGALSADQATNAGDMPGEQSRDFGNEPGEQSPKDGDIL
jgi:hypothetical protein